MVTTSWPISPGRCELTTFASRRGTRYWWSFRRMTLRAVASPIGSGSKSNRLKSSVYHGLESALEPVRRSQATRNVYEGQSVCEAPLREVQDHPSPRRG